jgi:hypothetical protein
MLVDESGHHSCSNPERPENPAGSNKRQVVRRADALRSRNLRAEVIQHFAIILQVQPDDRWRSIIEIEVERKLVFRGFSGIVEMRFHVFLRARSPCSSPPHRAMRIEHFGREVFQLPAAAELPRFEMNIIEPHSDEPLARPFDRGVVGGEAVSLGR